MGSLMRSLHVRLAYIEAIPRLAAVSCRRKKIVQSMWSKYIVCGTIQGSIRGGIFLSFFYFSSPQTAPVWCNPNTWWSKSPLKGAVKGAFNDYQITRFRVAQATGQYKILWLQDECDSAIDPSVILHWLKDDLWWYPHGTQRTGKVYFHGCI